MYTHKLRWREGHSLYKVEPGVARSPGIMSSHNNATTIRVDATPNLTGITVATHFNTIGIAVSGASIFSDQEGGLQRAWLENGTLYVNYEAKTGRNFGMRRTNSCYQLGNEIVVNVVGVSRNANDILHTENFLLIDKEKHIRGINNGLKRASIAQLIGDIQTLKSE